MTALLMQIFTEMVAKNMKQNAMISTSAHFRNDYIKQELYFIAMTF